MGQVVSSLSNHEVVCFQIHVTSIKCRDIIYYIPVVDATLQQFYFHYNNYLSLFQ